jgi:hypothetical protein
MNGWFRVFFAFAASGTLTYAATHDWTTKERGAHHKILERTTVELLADGTVSERTHRLHVLGTGMHRLVDGNWVQARNLLEILNGAAVARELAMPAIFAGNPSVGTVDSEAPDGKRFRCTVVGLALYDPATQQSLLIAELQENCQGEVHPPNVVFYPRALLGTLPEFGSFDLRYTVQLAGWEQDVLIRNRITLPAGWNPNTARLECWSRFVDPPEGRKVLRNLKSGVDENLDFGASQIGPGKVFSLDGNARWSARTLKTWIQNAEGTFLVEAVPWSAIVEELSRLPEPNLQAAVRKSVNVAKTTVGRKFPPAGGPAKRKEPMRMASAPMPKQGLVWDYSVLLSGTSVRLEGDKTYLIQSPVQATDLIIEGGTVAKYDVGASIEVTVGSGVACLTEPFRPAVLTSIFDGTVGEEIDDGQPPEQEISTALILHDHMNHELKHLRISYAGTGISLDDGLVTVKHSMFTHCETALYLTANADLKNVLIYDGYRPLEGAGFAIQAEHLTCDGFSYLSGSWSSNNWIYLTNSILTGFQGWGPGYFYTNAVASNASASTYQTVGSSAHYLANNSPYRNSGVTNTTIAGELKSKTTYPPVVHPYGVPITNQNLTLVPQAGRDTAARDLGFHFEPLDFVFSQAVVTNSTITVKPGTVIGVYQTWGTNGNEIFGMSFAEGSKLTSLGSPTNLARVVRIATVQELANTNWTGTVGPSIRTARFPAYPPPELNFRFTAFSMLANEAEHLRGYQYFTNMPAISVVDSRLSGGRITTEGPSFNFTNTLFERVYAKFIPTNSSWPFTNSFQNNLFYGGEVFATPYNTNGCLLRDNLFDQTILSNSVNVANSYNGYLTGYNRLNPQGSTDLVLTNISYDTGPLSRFYTPTNSSLINTGSVANASQLGMYWHTATANQTNEATSRIDIGLHFIALANGVALDWDGEGLANYLEDANGNGTTESTESNFNFTDTDADGVSDYLEYAQGRNRLTNAVSDINGIVNLRVYTPLK